MVIQRFLRVGCYIFQKRTLQKNKLNHNSPVIMLRYIEITQDEKGGPILSLDLLGELTPKSHPGDRAAFFGKDYWRVGIYFYSIVFLIIYLLADDILRKKLKTKEKNEKNKNLF